ncbi:Protein CBG26676 [Caenorhabditis briggsae]|uniref:Protein CBG26676 n=1 Tax=Caenorhabditis briggsae TaxID=6238 RepID=B6IE46_CAEBR|nr:Protein CBG26676 [Caenorhabditis briggsae]CAS01110.1 Protein CBG26676 [Caenorhabditis briggsae]
MHRHIRDSSRKHKHTEREKSETNYVNELRRIRMMVMVCRCLRSR